MHISCCFPNRCMRLKTRQYGIASKLLQIPCWFLVGDMCTVYSRTCKRDTQGVPNRTPSSFGDTALLDSSRGSQVFYYGNPILTDGMAGCAAFNSRSPRINPRTVYPRIEPRGSISFREANAPGSKRGRVVNGTGLYLLLVSDLASSVT